MGPLIFLGHSHLCERARGFCRLKNGVIPESLIPPVLDSNLSAYLTSEAPRLFHLGTEESNHRLEAGLSFGDAFQQSQNAIIANCPVHVGRVGAWEIVQRRDE